MGFEDGFLAGFGPADGGASVSSVTPLWEDLGLAVEVALGYDAISATVLTWTDITEYCRSITIDRGRDHWFDEFDPGSCTIVCNFAATDVIGKPHDTYMPVRVTVNDSSDVPQRLFTGMAMQTPTYQWAGGVDGTVTIRAQDALGYMNTYSPAFLNEQQAELSEPVFDALRVLVRVRPELSARLPAGIEQVANYQGLSSTIIADLKAEFPNLFPAWAAMEIETGQTFMQAIPGGGTALEIVRTLARSEGGAFFVGRSGTGRFVDRMCYWANTRISGFDGIVAFDDTGGGDSSYGADGFEMWHPPIYTASSVSVLGGSRKFTARASWTSAEGLPELSAPDLTGLWMSSSAEAKACAARNVMRGGEAFFVPKKLTLFPRRDDAQRDAAVKRELLDRVTVKASFATGSTEHDLVVEHISHRMTASGEWGCELTFSTRAWSHVPDFSTEAFVLYDGSLGALDGTRRTVW